MIKSIQTMVIAAVLVLSVGCATSYKVKPLPFKAPEAHANAVEVAGATVAARAFVDPTEANDAFGFNIRGAGMLPVQVVFDHQGAQALEINGAQTFLEDDEGNLWPLLTSEMAHERAAKLAQTRDIVDKGVYHGLLGAAAGAVIGAAIGIVTGENVAGTAGKGAAVGAAAGATIGGTAGYASGKARKTIVDDLRKKSLQNKQIAPKSLAFGVLFFPGEAVSARQLRLQLVEGETKAVHVLKLNFEQSSDAGSAGH